MKKGSIFIFIVYTFLFVSGSVHGVGEKTISLGGEKTWQYAGYRFGVTEVKSVRPYPVLVLSSAGQPAAGYSAAAGVLGKYYPLKEPTPDFSLSFDERDAALFHDGAGHYSVTVSPNVEAVDRRFSRAGTGAALFGTDNMSVGDPLIVKPQSSGALFAAGSRIKDFTIEFWLYPLNLENGEQILSWTASMLVNGNYSVQRIMCSASKNRLQWSFVNFFASSNNLPDINIEFSGDSFVVPKKWSHHLVRFDAVTGMIEYLVDGNSESIVYATSTGRESSEVFTPVTGNGGVFVIGGSFKGMMDEFKIHGVCAGRSSVQKYATAGGRAETTYIDIGGVNSAVVRVDASGGRTGIKGTRISNEFRENGRFRFSDDSEMSFFIRAAENPWLLNEVKWISFTPGSNITETIKGRYVQIAVDFYPSSDGETTPYLDEVRIVYQPNEPPLPPANFTAAATDGGVMLRWKQSPDASATAGYLVYYGSVRGELFGSDAALGPSPIDAGKVTSIMIDGLKNGTLYYFRVASYDLSYDTGSYNIGEFSREVTARPLATLPAYE
jgi:Fibronectin type III domain.